MDGPRDIPEAIEDALSDVMAREGEVVTKWLAIVDVLDASGERSLRMVTNPGAKAWDNVGMLTFALHEEQAVHVADRLGD